MKKTIAKRAESSSPYVFWIMILRNARTKPKYICVDVRSERRPFV